MSLLAAGPLEVSEITRLLLAMAVLLGLARFMGELARQFGQPTVLGEILAGILLGQTVFGAIMPGSYEWLFPSNPESAIAVAEEGFIVMSATLLLLVVGLEVDLSTVWRQGKAMVLVSAFGIVIPMGIGSSLGWFAPDILGGVEDNMKVPFAIFVGIALSITALPVIAKILMDLNLAKSDMGMLVISSAMLNDLVGWIGFAVVLALLPAAAPEVVEGVVHAAEHAVEATGGGDVAITIVLTLLFLAFMLTVGRFLAHKAMPYIQSRWSYPGGVLGFVFVIALLCAALTEHLGIHSIFGAFIAGVAIGDSHHLRERTRDTIHQFVTNIFAPIFFASIGLRINFVQAFDPAAVFLVFTVAMIGKVGGCYFGAKIAGLSKRESWGVGFGMAAQGAVGIILGTLAQQAGLISEELLVAIVIMALGTSLIAGPAMQKVLQLKTQKQLHTVLSDKHIIIDSPAKTIHAVLGELSKRAAEVTAITDDKLIFREVWSREQVMHTALPNGLAVPHARLPELGKPHVFIARSRDGIDFDAADGQLSRLICLILTPTEQPDTQIEMLALIAKAFESADVRARCMAAKSPAEFRAVLNQAASDAGADLTPHDSATLGME
ncbi:cation:proton antiporter domain-containing protein [Algisphaera agarilytica]|uniref:Kef-type K+ transport system membrane component KefB n=1 Tax=Algisphaera agarilytica TaxID=1385975 RepID=A0A7X0H341_9BACT|nr:cation:proton antiporter [Algisphaera agarilytica]MBB6428408.1 Kef-type K+ transport system membrane component KefB [Algisphaera agarilytica]